VFHVVICLLIGLEEDEEGRFGWDLGDAGNLSLLLLWILCGSPGSICWQRRPRLPALAHSPWLLSAFYPHQNELSV